MVVNDGCIIQLLKWDCFPPPKLTFCTLSLYGLDLSIKSMGFFFSSTRQKSLSKQTPKLNKLDLKYQWCMFCVHVCVVTDATGGLHLGGAPYSISLIMT